MADETERPDWTGGDGKPVDNHGVQRMAFPVVAGEIVRADWGGGGEVREPTSEGKSQLPVEAPSRSASAAGSTTGVARPDWDGSAGALDQPPAPARQGANISQPPAGSPSSDLVPLEGPELVKAQTLAGKVMQNVRGEDHAAFMQGYDALPEPTRNAVLSELSNTEGGRHEPATDEQLADFAQRPEGLIMIGEWGESAAMNLGYVEARLLRMEDHDPEAFEIAEDWYAALPADQAAAVIRALAGSF